MKHKDDLSTKEFKKMALQMEHAYESAMELVTTQSLEIVRLEERHEAVMGLMSVKTQEIFRLQEQVEFLKNEITSLRFEEIASYDPAWQYE